MHRRSNPAPLQATGLFFLSVTNEQGILCWKICQGWLTLALCALHVTQQPLRISICSSGTQDFALQQPFHDQLL